MVIENNIIQNVLDYEYPYEKTSSFHNLITNFGDNLFRDCTDHATSPTVDWSDITTGNGTNPYVWFMAGTGTTAAATTDYDLETTMGYFETSSAPTSNGLIDWYDEKTSTSEFVLSFTIPSTASTGLSGTISEIGIFMASGSANWVVSNAPPSTYDTSDTDKAPYRPFLVARAVIPAENRIAKTSTNSINWRWSIKFTG